MRNVNEIYDEIRRTLRLGNAYSVLKLLLSHPLSNRVYKTILTLAFDGYDMWFHFLRKECKLQILEIKVLRKIYGPKKE
jgi:hypothetical protein